MRYASDIWDALCDNASDTWALRTKPPTPVRPSDVPPRAIFQLDSHAAQTLGARPQAGKR